MKMDICGIVKVFDAICLVHVLHTGYE